MQERHSPWLGPSDLARSSREQSLAPRQALPQRPNSSFGSDLNKPLPPSPLTPENRSRNSSMLRGSLRREPPSHLETTHLRPQPFQYQHYGSGDDITGFNHHSHSRSMPNSPWGFNQSPNSQDHATYGRPRSGASNYLEAVPYTTESGRQNRTNQFVEQYYGPTDDYPSTRNSSQSWTHPPLSDGITTTRDFIPTRVRPHTWLSPTEPFTDISQFHLFAEATTGLPNDTETSSANSPPRLQGSLFARRSQNDTIPIPLMYQQESRTSRTHRSDWQNFEPPPVTTSRPVSRSTSTVPQHWQPPPHMQAMDMEMSLLGLDDEHDSDDELPDYAQSQAEMSAKKRAEASARARELEARWRGTRGR